MSIFTRRFSSWWLRTLALAGAAVSPDLALALVGWDAVEAPTGTEPQPAL
jgi:hypothetical protein